MTPAIKLAQQAKVTHRVHTYVHDPATASYGTEAAEKLDVPADKVFKTLVVSLDGKELGVAIVPVTASLSMKQMAKAAGAKKAAMAPKADVERATGYVLGGVSPLAQKKQLRTFIHASAQTYPTIYVSAGRRGMEIELNPLDLQKLTQGKFASLC